MKKREKNVENENNSQEKPRIKEEKNITIFFILLNLLLKNSNDNNEFQKIKKNKR